jgi:hypothetical protein
MFGMLVIPRSAYIPDGGRPSTDGAQMDGDDRVETGRWVGNLVSVCPGTFLDWLPNPTRFLKSSRSGHHAYAGVLKIQPQPAAGDPSPEPFLLRYRRCVQSSRGPGAKGLTA